MDEMHSAGEARRATVLFIEDDADLRLCVRLCLEPFGWDVTEAASGAEGLAAIRACDPDVILLDLGLPDTDGEGVLHRIKADEVTSWVPVVVLSGQVVDGQMRALLRAGAQDFMLKPFRRDELEVRLRAAGRVAVEHRRLIASERRYRQLVDRLPDCMVCVLDHDLRLTMAGGELLSAVKDGWRLGQGLDEIVPSAADRAVLVPHYLAALDGEATSFDFVADSRRHCHIDVAPLRDAAGEVESILVVASDVTVARTQEQALREAKDQLQHLSEHDPLTGLLNRRGFANELERQAAQVARYGPAGALLVLDLDNFKQVNDTLGHRAGDELLGSIADLLLHTVRETDVVARLGGDEFAIILPFATSAETEVLAAKVVKAVRDKVTVLSGEHDRRVTVSVGIALFDHPAPTGEDVLVNADLTMYEAKEAGCNQYAMYRRVTDTSARTALVDAAARPAASAGSRAASTSE